MKKIILFVSTFGFLIFSCADISESADHKAQESISLTGKVYGWTKPPLDITKCDETVPGNSSFPKLLFLDDSAFIKIMPGNCGDLGVCTRYYFGKYKVDNEALFLTFNSKTAVFHKKSEKLASQFVELENSDYKVERLMKRFCNNYMFFEECDVQGHLMTPKSDTLTTEIQYLKDNKILDKLFELKVSADT